MNKASVGIICTMSTSRMMSPPPLKRKPRSARMPAKLSKVNGKGKNRGVREKRSSLSDSAVFTIQ